MSAKRQKIVLLGLFLLYPAESQGQVTVFEWISEDDDDWDTNGVWNRENYPESGDEARHEDTELTDVRIVIDRSVEECLRFYGLGAGSASERYLLIRDENTLHVEEQLVGTGSEAFPVRFDDGTPLGGRSTLWVGDQGSGTVVDNVYLRANSGNGSYIQLDIDGGTVVCDTFGVDENGADQQTTFHNPGFAEVSRPNGRIGRNLSPVGQNLSPREREISEDFDKRG